MKLNNKGYMIIEIILASMIAFSIAYLLFDLTLNMKNKSDNMQAKSMILTDRTIIENYIMNEMNEADAANCGYTGKIENTQSEYIQLQNGSNITYLYVYNGDFVHANTLTGAGITYKKEANDYIVQYWLSCKKNNTDKKLWIELDVESNFFEENFSADLNYYINENSKVITNKDTQKSK